MSRLYGFACPTAIRTTEERVFRGMYCIPEIKLITSGSFLFSGFGAEQRFLSNVVMTKYITIPPMVGLPLVFLSSENSCIKPDGIVWTTGSGQILLVVQSTTSDTNYETIFSERR